MGYKGPRVQQQNSNGGWSDAKPIGWKEEHVLPIRILYFILGLSHCGKKGWRR